MILEMGKAYLVQDVLCSMERYAYCDPAMQMVVDFPSSAPGLEGKKVTLSPKDFNSQYSILRECPDAIGIFRRKTW
jgi:hypothetical protein